MSGGKAPVAANVNHVHTHGGSGASGRMEVDLKREFYNHYPMALDELKKEIQVRISYMEQSIIDYKGVVDELNACPFSIGDVVFSKDIGNGIIMGFSIPGNHSVYPEGIKLNELYANVACVNGPKFVLIKDLLPYTAATKVLYK